MPTVTDGVQVQRTSFREPTLTFPAVRGIQAGREYYTAMCQMRLIPRLFVFDEEELRPELRAQRSLNRTRIPQITRYLVENPESYTFSALTASIDGEAEFMPVGEEDAAYNIGRLVIPLSAKLLINDGQHRRAAIEEAIRLRPELGNESVPVVFFLDTGLGRSQQMFADLNTHAVRPSMSIGILYNQRDPVAGLARELARRVPLFAGRIEMEKTTISNRSTKLFTLSAVYQATAALLGKTEGEPIDQPDLQLALTFWTQLGELIPEWRAATRGNVSAADLRGDFVHAHGVALQALGRAGGALVQLHPDAWGDQLSAVGHLDWRRTNTQFWEGRALLRGHVSKAHQSVLLTTNVIKQTLGIPLTADEQHAEDELLRRGRTDDEGDVDEIEDEVEPGSD